MTQGSAELQNPRIEVLHAHGDGQPLFVFPDVYGEPKQFQGLAKHLSADRPSYGFRHIGSDNEYEPVRQITRLAQLYAADLRRAQPHGPYYLLGYDVGGAVAFETARELDSQAQKVGLVIMVDCAAPGYPQAAPLVQRARTHTRSLLQDARHASTRYLRQRIDAAEARVARRLGFDPLEIRHGQMSNQMRRVRAALHEAYVYYRPTPQSVDVLFLTAETPSHAESMIVPDPLLGWGSQLRGRISQATTPGAHATVFAPEHVAALASHVRHALAAADRRREPGRFKIKPAAACTG